MNNIECVDWSFKCISRGAGDYLSLLQELWVNAHCETAVIFLELEHGKTWKHLEFGGNTGELSWKDTTIVLQGMKRSYILSFIHLLFVVGVFCLTNLSLQLSWTSRKGLTELTTGIGKNPALAWVAMPQGKRHIDILRHGMEWPVSRSNPCSAQGPKQV